MCLFQYRWLRKRNRDHILSLGANAQKAAGGELVEGSLVAQIEQIVMLVVGVMLRCRHSFGRYSYGFSIRIEILVGQYAVKIDVDCLRALQIVIHTRPYT